MPDFLYPISSFDYLFECVSEKGAKNPKYKCLCRRRLDDDATVCNEILAGKQRAVCHALRNGLSGSSISGSSACRGRPTADEKKSSHG